MTSGRHNLAIQISATNIWRYHVAIPSIGQFGGEGSGEGMVVEVVVVIVLLDWKTPRGGRRPIGRDCRMLCPRKGGEALR